MTQQIKKIAWQRDNPYSLQFDDCYFPANLGYQQAQYVFLDGNNLTARFSHLQNNNFVIAETGFGTGLNLLAAWDLFNKHAAQDSQLHFISCEKYPLSIDDLRQSLKAFPQFAELTNILLKQYQILPNNSFQLFRLSPNVSLTLLIGDAFQMLKQLNCKVDAWFLDGFAPSKNPDMWNIDVLQAAANLSHPNTTFSTFTSSSVVRKNLQQVGFNPRKRKGFAQKREHLYGDFDGSSSTPKHQKPWLIRYQSDIKNKDVTIIGAGIAGISCGFSLAKRGFKVTIIEKNSAPAQEASGNNQGCLFLKLSAHQTVLSNLLLSGFGYMRRLLEDISRGEIWQDCGLLQLAASPKTLTKFQQLASLLPSEVAYLVDEQQASQLANISINHHGLFFPKAGWISPPRLCEYLLNHPNIKFINNCQITKIKHENGNWHVFNHEKSITSSTILINASGACNELYPINKLKLKAIRGQTTAIPVNQISKNLQTVICGDGYITPALHNTHTIGASFDLDCCDPNPRPTSTQHNLTKLTELTPTIAKLVDIENLHHKVGFRSTAHDNLPVVGPISDPEQFKQIYSKLKQDAKFKFKNTSCPWLPNLYLNMAHGSRGMITAPIAAEIITSYITNEPIPLPQNILDAIHPNRLLCQQLIKS